MIKRKAVEMKLGLPLVVILGATASGKTKLSLDLAKKFGGEIIGADSMQIYKNIDIISAKATSEERKVAPHHMIDILNPNELCTVIDYRNKALPISLLWKILIEEPGCDRQTQPGSNNYEDLSSQELHNRLKSIDPETANRLHPNNKRKILRSLEVFEQKGKLLSKILKEQQEGHVKNGSLRYPNTLIIWLKWEREILNDRINSRVDAMLEEGLLDELLHFHKLYNEQKTENSTIDYTKGIFQMIGFKEFHEYLMLSEEDRLTEQGQKMLQKGVEDLKMVTRRYAKKQEKWTKNRFLGRTDREVPPIFGLTTTDLAKWEDDISKPAISIIESFINKDEYVYKPLKMLKIDSKSNLEDETYNCETCDRIFIGEYQWNIHIKSNIHKRHVTKKKNIELLE